MADLRPSADDLGLRTVCQRGTKDHDRIWSKRIFVGSELAVRNDEFIDVGNDGHGVDRRGLRDRFDCVVVLDQCE